MRKLAPIFLVALAFGAVTCSKDNTTSNVTEALVQIDSTYIVVFKSTYLKPLISDPKFYEKSFADQQLMRKSLVDEVKTYCKGNSIVVDTAKIFVDLVVGFVTTMSPQKASQIKADGKVQSLTADVKIEGKPIQQGMAIPQGKPIQQDNDREFQDWGLTKRGNCLTSCAVTKAGGSSDGSTKTSVIWIVDTGIATGNPQLNVKTEWGWNFVADPDNNNANDDNGHGTIVAGVAAGKKLNWNDTSICFGVSAGATVVPIKVLDAEGSGYWSNIIMALQRITATGRSGDVINLSLGEYGSINCPGRVAGLDSALIRAGLRNFVVMASGNDQGNARRSAPGCTNGPEGTNLFTVAAATCGKQCVLFSNYGKPVDYVAVGTDVFSTYLFDSTQGKWTFIVASGTSISAGVISGVIHATGRKPNKDGRVFCRVMPRDVIDVYHYGRR